MMNVGRISANRITCRTGKDETMSCVIHILKYMKASENHFRFLGELYLERHLIIACRVACNISKVRQTCSWVFCECFVSESLLQLAQEVHRCNCCHLHTYWLIGRCLPKYVVKKHNLCRQENYFILSDFHWQRSTLIRIRTIRVYHITVTWLP